VERVDDGGVGFSCPAYGTAATEKRHKLRNDVASVKVTSITLFGRCTMHVCITAGAHVCAGVDE